MYIKAQTQIPAGTKITKCPTRNGSAKSVWSMLHAEERRLEREALLKLKANRLAELLKMGRTVQQAMAEIDD